MSRKTDFFISASLALMFVMIGIFLLLTRNAIIQKQATTHSQDLHFNAVHLRTAAKKNQWEIVGEKGSFSPTSQTFFCSPLTCYLRSNNKNKLTITAKHGERKQSSEILLQHPRCNHPFFSLSAAKGVINTTDNSILLTGNVASSFSSRGE